LNRLLQYATSLDCLFINKLLNYILKRSYRGEGGNYKTNYRKSLFCNGVRKFEDTESLSNQSNLAVKRKQVSIPLSRRLELVRMND
jgi:hypothetical protein